MNYTGIQAVYMCFFSKDLYRAVVRQWQGVAYLYLSGFIAVCAVILGSYAYYWSSTTANKYIEPIIDELPTMTLHGGKLSIDKPSPYYVKEKLSGATLFVFDTDDKTTEIKGDSGVLVNSTKITMKSETREETREFSAFPDGELTPKQIRTFMNMGIGWAVPICFAVSYPIFLMICMVQSLIYAAIGKMFTNLTNTRLSYGELIRISVVAMTPVLMIDTTAKILWFSVNSFLWHVVMFLITIGYLYFGVIANSAESATGSSPSPIER